MNVYAFSEGLESEIDIEARPDVYLQQFHQADPVRAYLFVIKKFMGEIAGDGLHYVFENRLGQILPEVIEGFHRLGMPQTAEVLDQAGHRLGSPFPRGLYLREMRLSAAVARVPDDEIKSRYGMSDEDIEADPDYVEVLKGEELFDDLPDLYFKLVETENGGFETAAIEFIKKSSAPTI